MVDTIQPIRIDIPAGRSGQVKTTCPECSHTRRKKNAPCLSVNFDEGIWNCHHCGWAGTLKSGGQRHELHWRKPKFRKPEPKPASGLPDTVIEWFAARGVSEAVLARNGITYGQTYMPQVEGWVDAVRFPYCRGEDLVNIKHRDDEKNFRMEVGCERILYGLNDMDPKAVIIVEGEIDKLSLEMAGFMPKRSG